MLKMLVLSFSSISSDPRVNRQIRLLSSRYKITAAGFSDPDIDNVEFVPLNTGSTGRQALLDGAAYLFLKRFERYYWSRPPVVDGLAKLAGINADIVIANDVDTLPLALHIAGTAKVVLDAHEYAPSEFEDRLWWRLLFKPYKTYLCRTYLSKASAMMTVSDGIAEEYHRNYGIRSLVITNAPPYHTLTPSPVRDQQIRLIHHGGAVPSRKLELMIEMMRHVDDRFTLDLMLVPSSRQYLKRLESLSQGIGNVRFVPPVPMPEIVSHINKYDMGLYILPDNSFNNWFALPNKIFEFIQARLGVAIGPSVEMARIVKNHGVGVVADSFKPRALAEKLNCLSSQDIRRFKERAHAAASSLSQESNCERLLGVIERLLGQAK